MAKPKTLRWERRPEDRPQELLDAALTAFAKHGYRSTRLDDVAEAAGVTKGTIYHYFDTKEELLLGALEHYQALAFERIEGVLKDTHLPPSARIRLLLRRMFSVRAPTGRYLLTLFVRSAAHEVPRVHERWLKDGPVRLWTIIGKLVEEGKKHGEFRSDADGDAGARVLVSGLILQLVWQQHAGAVPTLAIDEDRLIDSSVEIFLAGLRTHKRSTE